MTEKNYFLNIYNTMTGEFELVQVTKEVFQTYRRTKWHIEDSTERFYKHETQMSSLIGGENDGYERFHEFIDYDNTPENQAIEEMVRQSLRNILDLLPPPFRVDLLDTLHHFKKPRSAGDAVCLQGGSHGKADGFLCPAGVSHHQIGGQRVEPTLHAFYGGVESFQVNGDICPSALLHSAPPRP